MNNLRVGEWVICIDNTGVEQELELHEKYLVKDIEYCKRCGAQNVDVGIPLINQFGELRIKVRGHCQCGAVEICNVNWKLSRRFVPITSLVDVISEVNSILKPQKQEV